LSLGCSLIVLLVHACPQLQYALCLKAMWFVLRVSTQLAGAGAPAGLLWCGMFSAT
jgi:hypothetical protein